MASIVAVADHMNNSSAPPLPSQRQQMLDNDNDYYNIDECPTVEDDQHSTPQNNQMLIPERNERSCSNRSSRCESDYENTDELDRQIEHESSDDDEGDYVGKKKRIVLVAQKLDYVNSGDIDRELEIQTHAEGISVPKKNTPKKIPMSVPIYNSDDDILIITPGNSTDHDYMNSEELNPENNVYMNSDALIQEKHDYMNSKDLNPENPDYMNSDALIQENHDYMNDDAIDIQLFSDNISLKVESSSSTHSLGESVHPLRDERGSNTEVLPNPLPAGVVQRKFVPRRKASTLHRESEIKIENDHSEETDDFDPTVLNIQAPTLPGDSELTTSSMNMLLTQRVKSSVTPLTTTPSYRGVQAGCNNGPDLSKLGTFERTILQTTGPTSMPNVLQIPWYHEGISRHIAESLLTNKSVPDGTYLLRDSLQGGSESLTLSVRCQRAVKHYRILWDGKQFTFGLGNFSDIQSLREHFDNQPVISGDSGVLVQLSHPYPRSVAEPAIYFDPETPAEPSPAANAASGPPPPPTASTDKPVQKKWAKKDKGIKSPSQSSSDISAPQLSVNSKEGYLTKLGHHVKNWKKRWFVLYRNELKYFSTQDSKDPLKVIDLNDVTAVERDESIGKNYCLKLVTSYRTFFMYGTSDAEANDWVEILSWKLGQRSRSNSRI